MYSNVPKSSAINYKTTILFTVSNKPGELHEVLSIFKQHGLNLTKIESRPSRISDTEYAIFVDLEIENKKKIK